MALAASSGPGQVYNASVIEWRARESLTDAYIGEGYVRKKRGDTTLHDTLQGAAVAPNCKQDCS